MKSCVRRVGLALLGWSGLLSAAPIPGLYNTGVDATGALLAPNGVVDPHYTLTVSPDPGLPGPDAVTLLQVWPVAPAGPWIADGPLSRWISPAANTNAAPGQYTYTTTFDLTGFDPATARIEGKWSTDNEGLAVVLNGVTVHSGINQFDRFAEFFISPDSNEFVEFVAGENTLEFVVNNAGDAPGPTGLRVELIGFVEVENEPPAIRQQPPPLASAFEGMPISITVVADGSEPLSYQWKKDGADVPGQVFSFLDLIGETEESGEYTLVVTNAAGTVTSDPVRVYVVEPVPGAYATGVNDDGELLEDGDVDPHYRLIVNPDGGLEEAILQDTLAWPIVEGPWVSNPEGTSKWIGPQFNTFSSSGGNYTYRVTFDLTGYDPASVLIELSLTSDNSLPAILVNGAVSGLSGPGSFNTFTPLTLRAGVHGTFSSTINTLDFVVNNADAGATGLHVASFALGAARGVGTPQAPVILRPPAATIALEGDPFSLDVLADGGAPLAYQWRKNGTPLTGQTTAILAIENAQVADAGEYSVAVTNSLGEAVSTAGIVTVLPRVPGVFNTGVDATGQALGDDEEDAHYELVQAPEGVATGPALAISGIPSPPWFPNEDTARWIGLGPGATAPPGAYVYRLGIDLTGYDPATAQLKGKWAADDNGSVTLNGAALPLATGHFSTPVEFTIASGFIAGVNTLEFTATNGTPTQEPFDNPAGLLVTELRLGALPATAAPAPPVVTLAVQPDGRVKVSYTPVAGWKPYTSGTLAEASWQDATALFSPDGEAVSVLANPAELPAAYLRFHYEP